MKPKAAPKGRITDKLGAPLSHAVTFTSTISRKRKRGDLDTKEDGCEDATPPTTKKTSKELVEKRLKMFRKKAPQTFLKKLERAQTQRMIVVGRTRGGTDECPTEHIDIVGSTGNIYKVTVDTLPACTCPDSQKGNECKHKRSFLLTELKTIFENCPPIPTGVADNEGKDGTRKPMEGECPICYMELEEGSNELVWCKAACGNNMHKTCFEQWAASQRGNTVKCVYCRTPWEMDSKDLEAVKQKGTVNEDGYVNVAEHFGMSGVRDYSPYHPFWVRRTLGVD